MGGYNFDLQSAQRIVAAVKKVEGQKRNTVGPASPSQSLPTQFWAMLTGAGGLGSASGTVWDWVAVMPNPASMGFPSASSNFPATNMWQFRDPYTAGWACAREANDTLGIPPGSVVLLSFLGYGAANFAADGVTQLNGVGTIQAAGPLAMPDGQVPYYTFQFALPPQNLPLPIHDHRDNVTGAGFAFAVYHPGTSLPQQPWSM